MAEISVVRSHGLDTLAMRWRMFSRWWLTELNGLIPPGWRAYFQGEMAPRLLVSRNEDFLICNLLSSTGTKEIRLPAGPFSGMAIDAWLAEFGLKREGISIGLVLDRDRFFVRTLKVPKAALDALPSILDQEILRWTPFQLAEIWHSATVWGDTSADVLIFKHWIIRIDHADAAFAECGLAAGEADFLACNDSDAGFPPVISFRTSSNEDPPWARSAAKYLAIGTAALIVLSLAAIEWCQSGIATSVEKSLVEARYSAVDGRSVGNPQMRLAMMKADIGFMQIWEEVSRILPDNTFLSELRLADGTVTISGFSSEAARLVRVIDASPLFFGSVLTAAITPNATEQKDRFSITFKVRSLRSDGRPARASAESAS